ncbi:MAG: ABC transporter ATP-binding protein [Deltaproteobacteria bacterium]|nr:ABC transporter ATP-binding protein [Deltaproteobacteria bacterium]
MTERTPLVEARRLRLVRGGACVLDVPSLRLEEGETLALAGPNGAGKSTLLMCLASLWKPTQGELLYRGTPTGSGSASLAYRRKVAVVFQEPLLLDTSVFRNVASGLKLRGMTGREAEERVLENLELFRIGHLRDRSARTLSGGEAQRTSLARAFAVRPEVVFLDEPLAALDPPTREALLEDLGRSLRRNGMAAVFATHDRLEALRLADRMLVLRSGTIAQLGTPEEVMNRPVDEFVASFVGMESLLSGRVVEASAGTVTAEVHGQRVEAVGEAALGEAVLVGIRPESVTLLPELPPNRTSARNHFRGRVEAVTPHGPVEKVLLDCGFPLAAFVTRRSAEDLRLAPGQTLYASCKATGVHVIRKVSRPKGPA